MAISPMGLCLTSLSLALPTSPQDRLQGRLGRSKVCKAVHLHRWVWANELRSGGLSFTLLQQGYQIEREAGRSIKIGALECTVSVTLPWHLCSHAKRPAGPGYRACGAKRSRVVAFKQAFTVLHSLQYGLSVADFSLPCMDAAHPKPQGPRALARKLVSRMSHMRLTGPLPLQLSEGKLLPPGGMVSQKPPPQATHASMPTLRSRPIAPQASSAKRFCCKERGNTPRACRMTRSPWPLGTLGPVVRRFESSGRLIDFRSMRWSTNTPGLGCFGPLGAGKEQQG